MFSSPQKLWPSRQRSLSHGTFFIGSGGKRFKPFVICGVKCTATVSRKVKYSQGPSSGVPEGRQSLVAGVDNEQKPPPWQQPGCLIRYEAPLVLVTNHMDFILSQKVFSSARLPFNWKQVEKKRCLPPTEQSASKSWSKTPRNPLPY